MDYDVIRISSVSEIVKVLKYFNHYFPRTIESRVGCLDVYAVKLIDHAFVYAAKDKSIISGVAIFYANDNLNKVAYLSHLAVDVGYQNKGIGSFLLEFCCEISRQYGMTTLKLEVDNLNLKAISHYEKHNFRMVSQATLESHYMMKELT